MNKLKEQFQKYGFTEVFEVLAPQARAAIHMLPGEVQSDEQTIKTGASKLGGCPDLPKGQPWLTNEETGDLMSFFAQINLAEIHPFDAGHELPSSGMLYFFYDVKYFSWGFDPKNKVGSRVFFYEGPQEALERVPTPEGATEYRASSLSFKTVEEVPEISSHLANADITEEQEDDYLDLLDEMSSGEAIHKLLGHSNNIQNGMELMCELVHHGIYCGTSAAYRDPKINQYREQVSRWKLLCQINTSNDHGIALGDEACLYFWITEEDLKNRHFERAWQVLQSY
ncbi:YwqG family protein [Vaginella massiliensis]|uniref:YwqG family protein n=1 Tax=Flavobacteriales TaxID=200644 RepID=UPI000E066881|nr:YwqG family protein [Weeksella virosa]MDK7675132.1 YwqG family protein [Weeksella virosa]SUP53078.1 Domain of uncharacterised function (DUF1963) [Weeksella virosa]